MLSVGPSDPSTMVSQPQVHVNRLPQVTSQLLDEICQECLQEQQLRDVTKRQLVRHFVNLENL